MDFNQFRVVVAEQEESHMKSKVLRLSQSFNKIKDVNLMLAASTSRELVEDPFKSMERSKRWKIKSAYGDIGLTYRDQETVAYVASRMPAVYSACFRVLKEVRQFDRVGFRVYFLGEKLEFGANKKECFASLFSDLWILLLKPIYLAVEIH